MAINTISILALYCSRCGKIRMHELSRFFLKNAAGCRLECSCGKRQATITGSSHGQYILEMPCLICETNHIICVDIKDFWRGTLNKIYCPNTNLELGFSGSRELIEQTVEKHQQEFENLAREVARDEYVDNPQVMFEVLNKIHDIAEKGGVACRCGGAIEADIHPNHIELVCTHCKGRKIIAAKTEDDLQKIMAPILVELGPARQPRHREK